MFLGKRKFVAVAGVALSLVLFGCTNGSEDGQMEEATPSGTLAPSSDQSTSFLFTVDFTETDGREIVIKHNPARYPFDFTVDWGDGNVESYKTTAEEACEVKNERYSRENSPITYPADVTEEECAKVGGVWVTDLHHLGRVSNGVGAEAPSHVYDEIGEYQISLSGKVPSWNGVSLKDSEKFTPELSVESFGDVGLLDLEGAFAKANILKVPDSLPSTVTNLNGLFDSTTFNGPEVTKWETSNVTAMNGMFYRASRFDQPIGDWNTSNVTGMSAMFSGATSFNQPIGNWDTVNVSDITGMFSGATSFNQPIGNWNTSNVTAITGVFSGATSFNQPIGDWDTSNVTSITGVFSGATSFNQPIGDWDTSNVTGMAGVFAGAARFNQPIGNWDTSNVTAMNGMFYRASSFTQPIDKWDVANVTNMENMFSGAGSFNQNLSSWATCGRNVSSEAFSVGTNAWVLPKPNFSEC